MATVNQQPITNYDVEQRALFLEFATNIKITDQNRERIYEDALQLIIDDKLRLAEVKTMFPEVEAAVMPQVRDFMNQNFGAGGKSGSVVLRDAGIDPMTAQQKYVSDIAWSNYISERFSEKFSNVETLIDDEIERIKLNASKPQLKLSEIVLVPGQSRSLEATQALAGEMVAAIQNGSEFCRDSPPILHCGKCLARRQYWLGYDRKASPHLSRSTCRPWQWRCNCTHSSRRGRVCSAA